MIRARGRAPRVQAPVRRPTLARSVLLSQLLVSGALLVAVLVISILDPMVLARPIVFVGMTLIFLLTGVAFVVPWGRFPKNLTIVVPLLDIFAIFLLRLGGPELGFSLLWIFPVIWMTTYYGALGRYLAPSLCTVLAWLSITPPLDVTDLAVAIILPVILIFVATSTYLTQRRNAAQRVLLSRQAEFLDTALDRARQQENTLHVVLDAVDFAVIALEPDGTIALMNSATLRLAEKVGVDGRLLAEYTDIYRADRTTPYPPEAHPYRRVMNGEVLDREVMWWGRPGNPRLAISVTSRQLHDRDGRLSSYLIVGHDVTAEVNAIQARDDLVTSVSHELRTPLTSILGYLELAMDDEGLEDRTAVRANLEIASKNAERLLSLVSDLLVAGQRRSKIGYVLSASDVDLAAVVAESVESFAPVADEQHIAVRVQVLGDSTVHGDAFSLRQVVDNLLSNAFKYNVVGGRVDIVIRPEDEEYRELIVSDTGHGMSEEEMNHVFERFYRAESVRRTGIHGTGLGMPITRDIVEQHGGEISLRSTKGRGTTVTVRLPRMPASPQRSRFTSSGGVG